MLSSINHRETLIWALFVEAKCEMVLSSPSSELRMQSTNDTVANECMALLYGIYFAESFHPHKMRKNRCFIIVLSK